MNRSGILGLITGIAAILFGIVLEGGRVSFILQPAAAMIVFGGTFGATLLSYSVRDILDATLSLKTVFLKNSNPSLYQIIEELILISTMARKKGLVSVESYLSNIKEPFLKRMVGLAVDGMPPGFLKEVMNEEISTFEEKKIKHAQIFETAGAIAPTAGIIGAVIGLIHVMQNLSDPARLGQGIAVAFVATLYGVGSANIILLPIAKKIRNNLYRKTQLYRIVAEGITGIQSGIHPHYLKERLLSMADVE
ncbi:MAG: flagellar motor protein [Nitrospirae bacterium]|nr:flagellar motor protein [Nitrospirota bacterium]